MKPIVIALVVILALWMLSACTTASERHLTAEQDEYFASQCAQGCAVVPANIWLQIEAFLKQKGGI